MAIRRPLIVDQGRIRELPAGDSLDSSEVVTRYAVPIVAMAQNTVFSEDELPELVFSEDGDLIMSLVTEGEI